MRFTTFSWPKNTSDNNSQQTDNNQQAGTERLENISANDKSANDSQEGPATSETDNKGENEGEVNATYNLIILDESGSMSGVRRQTVSGCNETLNGIRSTA